MRRRVAGDRRACGSLPRRLPPEERRAGRSPSARRGCRPLRAECSVTHRPPSTAREDTVERTCVTISETLSVVRRAARRRGTSRGASARAARAAPSCVREPRQRGGGRRADAEGRVLLIRRGSRRTAAIGPCRAATRTPTRSPGDRRARDPRGNRPRGRGARALRPGLRSRRRAQAGQRRPSTSAACSAAAWSPATTCSTRAGSISTSLPESIGFDNRGRILDRLAAAPGLQGRRVRARAAAANGSAPPAPARGPGGRETDLLRRRRRAHRRSKTRRSSAPRARSARASRPASSATSGCSAASSTSSAPARGADPARRQRRRRRHQARGRQARGRLRHASAATSCSTASTTSWCRVRGRCSSSTTSPSARWTRRWSAT